MKPVIRPAAKEDILRQFGYYLSQDAYEAADRFLESVEQSVEALCRMPHMGSPLCFRTSSLAGLRAWPVEQFSDIRIYYLVDGDVIRVVRVLHGKRDVRSILDAEGEDPSL